MKKLIIIISLLASVTAFSQTTPRWLIGYNVLTGMPTTYKDTLRTYFYKAPMYTIGDSVYVDTSRSTYWIYNGQTLYESIQKNVGIGTTNAKAALEVAVNGIGTTLNDSLSFALTNNTAAIPGLQQTAPWFRFLSQGWATTAGTSWPMGWRIGADMAQGVTPVSNMLFQNNINNAGWTNRATLNPSGGLLLGSGLNCTTVVASSTVTGLSGGFGGASATTSTYAGGVNQQSNASALLPVRWSPYWQWSSTVWDSTASANRTANFGSEVRPISSFSPTASWYLWYSLNGGTHTDVLRIRSDGGIGFPATNTVTGTTGAQTINKTSGTVNIAAAGTTVTVTNSLVATTSIVFAVIRTNDATARIANVVPSAGSFVINLTAATTAETSIGFWVIN